MLIFIFRPLGTAFKVFFSMILLLSCGKQEKGLTVTIPQPISELCQPKVAAYNFGVEHYSVNKQVRVLDSLGMDGVMIRIPPTGGLNELKAFLQAPLVMADSFKVYDLFAYVSLTDSALRYEQLQTIEEIAKELEFKDTHIQVIFLGPNEDPTNAIVEVARLLKPYQKDLVIYPHYETSSIESAEEALSYINSIDERNVYLAFHLCHELAAGNDNRIREVIDNVSPYIKAVSISGADMSEFTNTALPNWYWGIKPLNMGTYDLSDFYESLVDFNVAGPITIHTWGIYNNFGLTPEEHLPVSKEIINQLAADACQ
jgi:sugar phosphate isomerase/epimerase